MFWDTNLFWIIIFIFQIIILNFLAKNFHSYLFHLTGFTHGNSKFSAKIAGLFLFIGTLVHELSHILMAAFLFVRVKALNMKTEVTEDNHIRFGTAEVEQVDPLRNSFVGIAPLIFGVTLIYFLALGINFQNFGWLEVFKFFLISQISNSMFLSKSDTVYFKYVFLVLITLFFILWSVNNFYHFINLNMYLNTFFDLLKNNNIVSFLKNLNLVFFFVIIFNFLINLLLKSLSKYKRY